MSHFEVAADGLVAHANMGAMTAQIPDPPDASSRRERTKVPWKRSDRLAALAIAFSVISLVLTIGLPPIESAVARENALSATIGVRHGTATPDGTKVAGQPQTLTITASNYVKSPDTIWVVVHTPFHDRYFPTRLHSRTDKPQSITVDVGGPVDSGTFQVLVYAVSPTYAGVFDTASESSGLGSLPSGVHSLSTITLIRSS
jgi:hypothetical protein